jgi:uncharacterized protein
MSSRRAAALCLLAALAAGAALALEVPFLAGRIVDQAGLLSSEEKQRIEQKLQALEQKSGAQVAVLTIPSLEGDPLEDYSMRVASTWKLGQKDKDNGVLFIVARDDRKMRLEVGYGLEEFLTDLKSGRILDEIVRPLFRQGQFGAGIEAGVDAVVGSIEGQEVLPAAAPEPAGEGGDLPARFVAFLVYAVVVTPFCLMAMFSRGAQSWFLYFFLMPFHLLFPLALYPALGPLLLAGWGVGFPIWKLLTRKADFADKKWFGGGFGGGSWTSGGGWSSGGGFSGGGGGGFSGGGGGFGGGGSSSSW